MKSDVLAPTEEHALSHEVLSVVVVLLLLWLRQTRLLHATCSETIVFFQSPPTPREGVCGVYHRVWKWCLPQK